MSSDPTSPQAPLITFLFTDLEGSTRNWEASPDGMRAAMERHDALLTEGIEQHGGRVILERGEGDSFFAVFERARDAVDAAGWIQRALAAETKPEGITLRVRMAIHTGVADAHLRGADVNRCARLRAIAHGGQVLVSAAARDAATAVASDSLDRLALVDLGLHRLRDLTHPERVFQLQDPDIVASFPPLRSMEVFRHNLPFQLTSFVGRERQLAEIAVLVRERHLVTLVGAGGAGKTRLALQVAADLLDEFEDGCWFVDLAPLAKLVTVKARAFKEAVPRVVAQVLEVREEPGRPLLDTLAQQLAGKRLLLVLDNCEHLIQPAAEVAEALARSAPGLRILATSREPLAVPGELAWRVPSLSLPDLDRLRSPEEFLDSEAVRLFLDRAATARPGFTAVRDDEAAIAGICARLDGIPLAIELAAARVRVVAPPEILSRLEDRFRLLIGGSRTLTRHQTLRAAVEWSHQLLTEPERVLFRRLAVFSGSFDLEAAERVGAGEPLDEADVLDHLGRLLDKSLLVADERDEGGMRYRFLETLRRYAIERLEESGEADAIQGSHLDHFLGLAERAYAERFENEGTWLVRLEREHDNLRAALAWARDHRPAEHLRLAGALGWFWKLHSHLSEGRSHLREAQSRPRDAGPEVARVLLAAGTLGGWQGDVEAALSLLEDARAMYETLSDPLGVALSHDALGWILLLGGDEHPALDHFEQALAIQRELENPRLIALAKAAVCQIRVAIGDLESAEPMAREILAAALAAGDNRNLYFGYHYSADCALARGDGAEAERLYGGSLRAALANADRVAAAAEVEGIAMSNACRGDALRGLRLGGAVEARREELGVRLSPRFWEEFRARHFGRARAQLGAGEADAAWQAGRVMEWEAAVADALGEVPAAEAPDSTR